MFSGTPKPTFTWSFGGKDIQDGGRFSITNVDFEYSLNIKEATEADSGTYKLTAKSSAGEVTMDMEVKVTAKAVKPT